MMKKALAILVPALILAACNKSPVKETSPVAKPVAQTQKTDAASGCGFDGMRYYTTNYGVLPGGMATDNNGNLYASAFIYNYGFTSPTFIGMGSAVLQKTDVYGTVQWLIPVYSSLGLGQSRSNYTLPLVKTDAAGNIYAIYRWVGVAQDNQTYLNCTLAKYDPSGHELWEVTENTGSNSQAICMNIDDAGNIYIASNFDAVNAEKDFTLPLTGSGSFTQKFDTNGNSLVVHKVNATGFDRFFMDKNGNVYCLNIPNSGPENFFKITFDGTVVWQKSLGSATPDHLQGDDNGNTVLWGQKGIPTVVATGMGVFDANGNLKWRYTNASPGIYSVSFDAGGNVYVVGFFSGAFNFDPNGDTELTAKSSQDIYVQKFDPTGKFTWAKQNQVAQSGAPSVVVDDTYVYLSGATGQYSQIYNTGLSLYGLRMSQCK
jgi:hypothetical protein